MTGIYCIHRNQLLTDDQISSAKPYVTVIAGSVVPGKSTIAAALSKALNDAAVLFFALQPMDSSVHDILARLNTMARAVR